MLRKACAALCAAVLLVGLTSVIAEAHTPSPGALFNNPRGAKAARYRIVSDIVGSIRSSPTGSTIRIAAYSFDLRNVADALVAACKRHVAVQMVLNDNWTSPQTRRLRKLMGTNIRPHYDDRCNRVEKPPPDSDVSRPPYAEPSFVIICTSSCRGGGGNQHMKFYLFSRAGRASNVTMVGSANLTGYGAYNQWNDMFTVPRNKGMFELYSQIFRELAQDRRLAKPYVHQTVGDLENWFSPRRRTSRYNDPTMVRLNRVRCRAARGTGINGRTAIRIVMYGWNGTRGRYLAQKVASLRGQGCNVRVIVSAPGHMVVIDLKRRGVLVKSASLDLDGNPDNGFEDSGYEVFTHQKYMLLSGGFGGTSSRNVWTGSENWSNLAFVNDEVNVRIPRRPAYAQYLRNFNYIWNHSSRWL